MILAIVLAIIALAISVGWSRYRYEQILDEASDPKAVREYLRQRYTIDE